MKSDPNFHNYLIRYILLLFTLPVLSFIVMMHAGINARLSFLLVIGLFIFILFSITRTTIDKYNKPKIKNY